MSRTSTSIPQFIADVRNVFPDKESFTIQEIKKMPALGISVNGKIWQCYVEGSKPKMFSIAILEERFNNGEFGSAAPAIVRVVAPKNEDAPLTPQQMIAPSPTKEESDDCIINMYIPGTDPDFVPYGKNYDMVKTIVSSGEFFPCYIYGISGVGKTSSIEHVCSVLKKPFFRVQITPETIDEDLIGSMKLVNGDTVWQDGPIIKAYRCGGVVVLDECDLNSSLMILQPILEKKPFYIKQTGELVEPKDGFTVFATGNTKGDGNDPRYIGTTTLNDAFLERFAITLEQTFMPISEETKIAKRFCRNNGVNISAALLKELMKLVDISRQTYVNNHNEGVYISTRRINFILKAYKMTQDMETALDMTLARYSDTEREALKMIWKSVHVDEPVSSNNDEQTSTNSEDNMYTNNNNNQTYGTEYSSKPMSLKELLEAAAEEELPM